MTHFVLLVQFRRHCVLMVTENAGKCLIQYLLLLLDLFPSRFPLSHQMSKFGTSTVDFIHRVMLVAEILKLKIAENVYRVGNTPIVNVQIVGVIVGLTRSSAKITIDGTIL
jgi:hypothetical protein